MARNVKRKRFWALHHHSWSPFRWAFARATVTKNTTRDPMSRTVGIAASAYPGAWTHIDIQVEIARRPTPGPFLDVTGTPHDTRDRCCFSM